jgi:dCMP deaminase
LTSGRQGWDETWLGVASVIAGRSLCCKSRVGSVIVTADNRVSSTGYNGPPHGLGLDSPCSGWCPHARADSGAPSVVACTSVHAEVNALLRADATVIRGGTIYTTRVPCAPCARVVANSGLSSVVSSFSADDDPDRVKEVVEFLRECGLQAAVI